MSLALQAVSFYAPTRSSPSAWLRMRRNLSEDIRFPEWQWSDAGQPLISPVACSIEQAASGGLFVRARVKRLDSSLKHAQIRALPISAVASPMGGLQVQAVTFQDGADSEIVRCELNEALVAGIGVAAFNQSWVWQYRQDASSPWTQFAITTHPVYLVLSQPKRPWSLGNDLHGGPADDLQIVWADVLEHACSWAAGALSRDDAATRITRRVFALGPEVIQYGCPIGAREMYANTVLNFFNCTAFLQRLRGQVGNGPYVNCTDCASIVSTFANALGCDLSQSRMGMYVPSFQTNPILAIGGQRFESPCGLGLGFMYHEVAWTGLGSEYDHVFDACLAFNVNPIPLSLAIRWVPTGIAFGLPNQGLYRDRLAAPGHREICRPRPLESRRRVVI